MHSLSMTYEIDINYSFDQMGTKPVVKTVVVSCLQTRCNVNYF